MFHQPDWQPLDSEEFRRIVSEFTVAEGWVVDGGYSAVSDIVWGRAHTVIWVDPPRHRLMRQLVPRTLRRMATGTELWNGNRERWRYLFRREESVLLFAWTNHRRLRARYESAQADPKRASATATSLRTSSAPERERVRELHAQGVSQYAIAERLKRPRSSVAEVLRLSAA